jgi:hypothetical protein
MKTLLMMMAAAPALATVSDPIRGTGLDDVLLGTPARSRRGHGRRGRSERSWRRLHLFLVG